MALQGCGEDSFSEVVRSSLQIIGKSDISILPQQREALSYILSGRDTFINLPTGFGKSLIFELTPLCVDRKNNIPLGTSKVLILSPLISLMDSQVQDLQERGQKAARLSWGEDPQKVPLRDANYVFLSPEAMQERKWVDIMRKDDFRESVCAVFVDEAHCIVQWGMGDSPFRTAYASLGDIRSFTRMETPMIAMTATATKTTMAHIVKIIGMQDVAYIVESPNRSNIRFAVHHIPQSDPSVFSWLLDELREKGKACEKVLIFCRRIDDCAMLYQSFATTLGKCGYIPTGNCILQNAIFGMFHSKITDSDKEILLESFSKTDGKCRVIFSTIAFGMGVNIPNVRHVIHFGPSSAIDNYVQESGRAGRDTKQSHAVIYLYPGALRGHVSKSMKQYCKTEFHKEGLICRRYQLFKGYLGSYSSIPILHNCCDICTKMCKCGSCVLDRPKCIPDRPAIQRPVASLNDTNSQWTDQQARMLKKKLKEMCNAEYSGHDELPLQEELITGMSDVLIETIVRNAHHINTVEELTALCPVWGSEHDIMKLIRSISSKSMELHS